MTVTAVCWTAALGILILAVGLFTYRTDVAARAPSDSDPFGLVALGPVLVAASIAAFAGEHFAAGPVLAQLVPKFMPARLFISYFVGVAHLAAAVSLVAKRYVRWSSLGLALMFALFVLLMDLPSAIASPSTRIFWILTAREGTFAIGGLALYASTIADDRVSPNAASATATTIATIARLWTAAVLILFGIQNMLFPQFAPGVPSPTPTPTWLPLSSAIAYLTGALFIVFGVAMFVRRLAAVAAARCGTFIVLLTVASYGTQFFIARGVPEQITALNFIFDTLLFGGTVLVVAKAIRVTMPDKP